MRHEINLLIKNRGKMIAESTLTATSKIQLL